MHNQHSDICDDVLDVNIALCMWHACTLHVSCLRDITLINVPPACSLLASALHVTGWMYVTHARRMFAVHVA